MARKVAIENMREVLLQRREALRKALKGDLSLLNELRAQAAGDVVDFAIDSAQDEINSQIAEAESRELGQIEEALKRMKEGSYGQCEGCGTNIPVIRLQALPYATYCIQCQQEIEQNGELSRSAGDWSRVLDSSDDDTLISDLEMDVS
ncbi:MAG: TraR/DksA family transcriptional regulator [Pirellulaceae bacterium]|nr:TraR/DksA C4-type zinc finger protein [Planctomycetales bacterium]